VNSLGLKSSYILSNGGVRHGRQSILHVREVELVFGQELADRFLSLCGSTQSTIVFHSVCIYTLELSHSVALSRVARAYFRETCSLVHACALFLNGKGRRLLIITVSMFAKTYMR
jgi:hypothetical protein